MFVMGVQSDIFLEDDLMFHILNCLYMKVLEPLNFKLLVLPFYSCKRDTAVFEQ